MGRLVVFSLSSFCLAFVALAGLAAYTAAHPFDAGVVAVSTSANPPRRVEPVPAHRRSAPRQDGRAPYGKVVYEGLFVNAFRSNSGATSTMRARGASRRTPLQGRQP